MKKKGSVFIAMGLLLLAAALLLTLYNLWDGHRADVAAQAAVSSLKTMLSDIRTEPTEPEPSEALAEVQEQAPTEAQEQAPAAEEAPEETAAPLPALLQERAMPTLELEGYNYIGVLEVPDLELSLPVMEQWDYDRLKISPCRFAGNLYTDDLVICAHNYAHHFTPLKTVPLGTEIRFTDAEGTVFTYAVASFDTVGPNDVERMIHGDWDLTLFTCNTNGQTRCAIRCDRIQ